MLSGSTVTKEWLKDRLALEEAVSKISRMLLVSDMTDLKDVISIIGEASCADRTSIILFDSNSGKVESIHEWTRPVEEGTDSFSNNKKDKFHQHIFTLLKNDEIIMIPDLNALPPETPMKKIFEYSGRFRSFLVIPFNSGVKHQKGVITFENFSRPREWLGDEVQTFRVISEMISAHRGRKKALKDLEESEKKYRDLYTKSKKTEELYLSLINSSADAIVITDLKGLTRYVNPSFFSLFGWDISEVKGKEIPFIPRHILNSHETLMMEVVEKGIPCQAMETERYTRDGRVLDVSLSTSLFYDHDGTPAGILFMLRDISEKKKLEAQLLQAQKMEAIGTLAGGIAHDFNNNLQSIFGCTEILLIDKDQDHPDFSKLKAIESSAQRASDLTKRLLIFGRKMENKFEPLNLNNEVTHLKEIIERIIPKMINIELSLSDKIKIINADSGQLEQVMMNLSINARDAMPEGGNLEFGTDLVLLERDFCDVNPGSKQGEYVRLRISDNGHGMDEHTLKHIYEPFFSTKKQDQGTGLGLAMVYGIVKSHEGYIKCSSEPGTGTTFDLYFPVSHGYHSVIQNQEKPAFLAGKNETILFVEDDDVNREIGKEILSEFGYNVVAMADCQSALDYFKKNRDKIELVISDLIMPGIGGKNLLKKILQADPSAKVIIASGYSTEESAQMVKKWGAKDFISKPYKMDIMLSIVRRVLNNSIIEE